MAFLAPLISQVVQETRASARVARVEEVAQQGRYETRTDRTIKGAIPAEQVALEVPRPPTLYDTPVRDIYSNVKADLSKPQEVQHTGQMFDPTKTFAYSGGFGSLFQSWGGGFKTLFGQI